MIQRTFPHSKVNGISREAAAADWLVRMTGDDITPEDRAAFSTWLAESAANVAAYARAEAVWEVFDDPIDDPMLAQMGASALEASQQIKYRFWAGGAAAIAASLLVAFGLLNHWDGGATSSHTSAGSLELHGKKFAQSKEGGPKEFVTAKGEMRKVWLDDGSNITLNTDTSVRVAYDDKARRILLLSGQALFTVAKEQGRPFIVEAGGRQVTALGTIFEVRLDQSLTKVTLLEGKVVVDEVKHEKHANLIDMVPTKLSPGEALVMEPGMKPKMIEIDVGEQLRWQQGFVEFHGTKLEDAVYEMNRYTSNTIIIRENATKNLLISGVYRTGNIQRFVDIVGEILPIKQRELPDGSIELLHDG